MRLFITSYQKSGTHQIMPALSVLNDVVDRSHICMTEIPEYYGCARKRNEAGVIETCKALRKFSDKAFGHVAYVPEYAEAVQAIPTKVLFNVRDPRDVVVANLHNIRKIYFSGKFPGAKGRGHLNLIDNRTDTLLILGEDPVKELIKIESARWRGWLGWLNHDFVLKVKYEDLRLDGLETLKRMAEWLEPYHINPYNVVQGLSPNHGNKSFRAGRVGDWKTEFTDEHKELANKLMKDIIEKLGYEL